MRLVGTDAETFYDPKTKYSLTSMGAEAYIRDARFEEIGWAARVEDPDDDVVRPTRWFDARRYDDMHDYLVSLRLDEPGTIALAHNGAGFDFMILDWVHGIKAWRWVDTLAMSRWRYGRFGPGGEGNSLAALARHHGLGQKGTEVVDAMGKRLSDFTGVELAKYGRYCANDTELMMGVFRKEAPWFQPVDFTAMHLFANMSADARIQLDLPLLRRALLEEKANRHGQTKKLADAIGVTPDKLKSAMMSNPKFAQILEALGTEVPFKVSKTTGKPTFAFAKTDPAMQEMSESDDELLANVVRLRTGLKSTIMESRLERFIEIGERGAMPAALRVVGAHTGRGAADGGVHKGQTHNIPKRANARNALRVAMGAGTNRWWYAADSSQIEVRVMAWLSNERKLLRKFARGEDPYLGLGPTLFGREITKEDKYERGINKAAILAAQFKQGSVGFRSHCKRNGIDLDEDMATRTIAAYRDEHQMIGLFWKQCREAIKALAGQRGPYRFGHKDCLLAEKGWLTLPSGRKLEYRECTSELNTASGYVEYTYLDKYSGVRKYLYDGKLTENCLAGDTRVITPRGAVPLVDVRDTDLVWDGVEWVRHEGLVHKGEQDTIDLGGLRLTPDHLVLVGSVWRRADEVDYEEAASQDAGFDWGAVRGADRQGLRGDGRSVCVLDSGVLLRGDTVRTDERVAEVSDAKLRVPVPDVPAGSARGASDVHDTTVRCMAVDEGAMSEPETSRLEELRGARDKRGPSLAARLLSLLAGYGRRLRSGVGLGPAGQCAGVQQRQLPLGRAADELFQPPEYYRCGDARRGDGDNTGGETLRHTEINTPLPVQTEPPTTRTEVYDLLNAGPRHRFAVVGGDGRVVIVHNCVQAIAYDVLIWQAAQILREEGHSLVLFVHDELAYIGDEDEVDYWEEMLTRWMTTAPDWMPGLPLGCEFGHGPTYADV